MTITLHRGICQNCDMRGLLMPRVMVPDSESAAITGITQDDARTLMVCITCYETPAGVKSENVGWVKLED